MRFVDTNVLIYAVSTDPDEAGKSQVARSLLEDPDLGLSAQVLQEFYVQATRATRPHALTRAEAVKLVEAFARFPVQATTTRLVVAAIGTHERFGISYWDAAIVEAARSLDCDVVLSEDLGDGQDYGGVRVQNPFRGC